MNVLVLCETSGAVREAFKARGNYAISVDLLPSDGGVSDHIQGDALTVARSMIAMHRVDLVIAHPPCTYLSASGLHWNKRRPGRSELTESALQLVRDIMGLDCERIAIENPVGCISTRIRKADQYIQPYMFGHDASKKTGLWLKNLPQLRPTAFVEPRLVCCGETVDPAAGAYGCPYCCGEKRARPRWSNQTASGQNRLGPSADRWKQRAKTYQGIADAMAEQWTLVSGA